MLSTLGLTRAELARACSTGAVTVGSDIAADTVAEWERRKRIGVALRTCLLHVAAENGLVWGGNDTWAEDAPLRMAGRDVAELRGELGWTQARLALELGTKQQQVAAWESEPEKQLSGLASYALRAVRDRQLAV